ncbi:MAG TPA: pyrimidine dimer DNA glycosylase/endonuclease V [Bacilli bacterium]|nr:pyrimidine dimer DNA glycosylase/endonuclease V [Bacilli bacterium]
MRLWHYQLIKALPRSQLLAQWRELNLIFRQKPNHILINYIYEDQYKDQKDLLAFSNLVIEEMKKRGYRVNLENFNDYFHGLVSGVTHPFKKYQNNDYLKICFYNLKEKYLRGQKDFSAIDYQKLLSILEIVEKKS